MAAVIVYGPQGSGKTLFAKEIAAHYGKAQIIETDGLNVDELAGIDLADDALILLNDYEMADHFAKNAGAEVVHIEIAKKAAGVEHNIDRHPLAYSYTLADGKTRYQWRFSGGATMTAIYELTPEIERELGPKYDD